MIRQEWRLSLLRQDYRHGYHRLGPAVTIGRLIIPIRSRHRQNTFGLLASHEMGFDPNGGAGARTLRAACFGRLSVDLLLQVPSPS